MASDDKRRLTLWKRKAWKSNGLSRGQERRPTAWSRSKNGAFALIVQEHKAGAFVLSVRWCYIPLLLRSNHSGYKIALNNLLYWNLKSRVGSYRNQYERNLIRIFRRMESVPSCLGFFRSVVTHNSHWWVGLYQRTNLLKFRCEQNSNITRI